MVCIPVSHSRVTVDSWLCGIQASRILIKPANITKKIPHFHKLIQKQICDTYIFTNKGVILLATTSSAVILPHTSVIRVETSRLFNHFQHMYLKSFTH
jgi:hypothetical protein